MYPLGLFSRKAVLCVRSRLRLPIGARLSRPYKALSTPCFTGNSSHPRRRRFLFLFKLPAVYKKRHRLGGVWCTRWGSNPDSTASEAVMLSNYTTSTFFCRFHQLQLPATILFYCFCLRFASVYGIFFLFFQKNFSTNLDNLLFLAKKQQSVATRLISARNAPLVFHRPYHRLCIKLRPPLPHHKAIGYTPQTPRR